MKFPEGVERARRKNRLDFGGDPESFVDPRSFLGLFIISLRDRYCHLSNMYELMYAVMSACTSAETRVLLLASVGLTLASS